MDTSIQTVFTHVFDADNQYWDQNADYNTIFLHYQKTWCQDLLRARGHVFLNEVYDMLGFRRTSEGQLNGWISNPDRDQEMIVVKEDNGYLVVEITVDGAMYDKI